jgi:hypothetical protein
VRDKVSADITSVPNIEHPIRCGNITLGGFVRSVVSLPPWTEITVWPCLSGRRRETLAQFLIRLDQVIEKAITEDIHTDEIKPKY